MIDFELFHPERVSSLNINHRSRVALLQLPPGETVLPAFEALLRCYLKMIPASADLTLIVLLQPDTDLSEWKEFDDDEDDLPDLLLLQDQISLRELADLYALADYVLCLEPCADSESLLQAMACNKDILAFGAKLESAWQERCKLYATAAELVAALLELTAEAKVALRMNRTWLEALLMGPDTSLARQYDAVAGRLLDTEVVSILFWGRSGSFFLQSLLDQHPELLTICGQNFFPLMRFYSELWPEICSRNPQTVEDILDAFCTLTCQQQLAMTLDAETVEQRSLFSEQEPEFEASFRSAFLEILTRVPQQQAKAISRQYFFILIHYAYAVALGQDISRKRIIIYQVHGPENMTNIQPCLQDFPAQRVMGIMRDPIRGLYSMLARARSCTRRSGQPDYLTTDMLIDGEYIKIYRHLLIGWQHAETFFNQPLYPVRLEALHEAPREALSELCNWLGVDWHGCLLSSTADGRPFIQESGVHGLVGQEVFSVERTNYTDWKEHFGALDSFVLRGLLAPQMNAYGFPPVPRWQHLLACLLVFVPTLLELQAFRRFAENDDMDALKISFLSMLERWFYTLMMLNGFPFYSTLQNWDPKQRFSRKK